MRIEAHLACPDWFRFIDECNNVKSSTVCLDFCEKGKKLPPQEKGAIKAKKAGLHDLAEAGNQIAEQIKNAKPAPDGSQSSFRK